MDNSPPPTIKIPKPDDFVPVPTFEDDPLRPHLEGHLRCQAWSKRHGRQCNNPAMVNRKHCRIHGGKNLRGTANPAYKHGLYSEFLPLKLKAKYEQMGVEEDLYSLKPMVQLLDARIAELFENMEGKEVGSVDRAFKRLLNSFGTNDPAKIQEALADMQTVIDNNRASWMIWREVTDLFEKKRRMIETDRNTMLEAEKTFDLKEVGIILGQLGEIFSQAVFEQLSDHQHAQRIIEVTNTRIQRLFG